MGNLINGYPKDVLNHLQSNNLSINIEEIDGKENYVVRDVQGGIFAASDKILEIRKALFGAFGSEGGANLWHPNLDVARATVEEMISKKPIRE